MFSQPAPVDGFRVHVARAVLRRLRYRHSGAHAMALENG